MKKWLIILSLILSACSSSPQEPTFREVLERINNGTATANEIVQNIDSIVSLEQVFTLLDSGFFDGQYLNIEIGYPSGPMVMRLLISGKIETSHLIRKQEITLIDPNNQYNFVTIEAVGGTYELADSYWMPNGGGGLQWREITNLEEIRYATKKFFEETFLPINLLDDPRLIISIQSRDFRIKEFGTCSVINIEEYLVNGGSLIKTTEIHARLDDSSMVFADDPNGIFAMRQFCGGNRG